MPLSKDPSKQARQLANLKRGGNSAPAGNARALRHGATSELLLRDVEAEVRELHGALAEAAPVRDAEGGLPAADVAAVERAARALKRWRHVSAWCDLHGRLDEKTGDVKPAARYELEAERELGRALDGLGMSPMARSKLGVNLAQQFDLARHWMRQDAEADRG